MARLKIILIFAGCIAVLLGIGVYRGWSSQEETVRPTIEPAVVRVASLKRTQYVQTETFYGLIEANTRVDMAFQIAGRVVALGPTAEAPLTEDSPVKKGDVIAQIEPERYRAAVDQANAMSGEAKAQLAAAEAQIADAQARLDDAQSEMARLQQLRDKGAANQREVEKAELAVKLNQAMLDTAKSRLASAEAMYQSSQAALNMAQVNLRDATIIAPIDGYIAAVPVEIGQMIQPGQTVISIVDLSKVKLVAGVVERKLPLLRKGQVVDVEVNALSSQARRLRDAEALAKPRKGRVTIVPPAADPVENVFKVEIEIPNEDRMVKPGMIGAAKVEIGKIDAVVVPADAAVRVGDKAWAFFVGSSMKVGLDLGALGKAAIDVPTDVARRVEFEPRVFEKNAYLVTELPKGYDRLVVEGQERLEDGEAVRVVSESMVNGQ